MARLHRTAVGAYPPGAEPARLQGASAADVAATEDGFLVELAPRGMRRYSSMLRDTMRDPTCIFLENYENLNRF